MKGIYSKKRNVVGAEHIKYIWTRDSDNHFDIEEFKGLNEDFSTSVKDAILEISTCINPNIIQIDIFRQLIILNVYDFRLIRSIEESSIYAICRFQHFALLKIVLDEASTPVNMYIINKEKYYVHVIENINWQRKILDVYIRNVKTFDIALIYCIKKFLTYKNFNEQRLLKQRISAMNLNLNDRYLFDLKYADFISLFFDIIYSEFEGKITTLNRIINLINDDKLNYIFDLDSKSKNSELIDFIPEFLLVSFNFFFSRIISFIFNSNQFSDEAPVYSLSEFVNNGVLISIFK